MISAQRILICPLDWGLGHATRCIPLIKEIQKQGAIPVIAAGGRPLMLLKEEFPELEYIKFPGYTIQYASNGNMVLSMLLQLPKILFGIYSEHRFLNKIIVKNKIAGVISDNRFGLFTKAVPSIFMSHQIFIKAPQGFKFIEDLMYKLNTYFINKYKACWIPDFPDGTTLSGELSHQDKLPENCQFIGPLSRFSAVSNLSKDLAQKWDLLVVLSGPEPQRSLFENLVLKQLEANPLQVLMVRGTPGASLLEAPSKNISIKNHLPSAELKAALEAADLVLCRPGYSSIMDLAALQKKAVFVPTPGQTEQEYLAAYFAEQALCSYQIQQDFDLKKLMQESQKDKGMKMPVQHELLVNAVQNFLTSCAEK